MKPVIPGQSLQTNMWQEGNRIHFQTSTVEENLPVLTGKLHFCIIAKFCNIIVKYLLQWVFCILMLKLCQCVVQANIRLKHRVIKSL